MSIFFQLASDLHTEFPEFIDKILPSADYLLLAGDIGNPLDKNYEEIIYKYSLQFKKIFIIPGNHEYYPYKNQRNSISENNELCEKICNKYDNVIFLNNSYYDLLVLNNVIRIIGTTLWSNIYDTAPEINDKLIKISDDIPYAKKTNIREIHKKCVEYLKKEIENSPYPVLIMTHHLPSYNLILGKYLTPLYNKYNSHFASKLEELFVPKIKAWVCGHSHGFNHIMINNTQLYLNPQGYPFENKTIYIDNCQEYIKENKFSSDFIGNFTFSI
jgi:hypothetical protein